MKRRESSRSTPTAEADTHAAHAGGADNSESGPKRHHGEGAGSGSMARHAGDVHDGRNEASARRVLPELVAGEHRAATSGHGRHLPEEPAEGTKTPRAGQLHPFVTRQLLARALTVSTSMFLYAPQFAPVQSTRHMEARARSVSSPSVSCHSQMAPLHPRHFQHSS